MLHSRHKHEDIFHTKEMYQSVLYPQIDSLAVHLMTVVRFTLGLNV